MRIFGIGVDIVENSRFKKLLKKQNFAKRIFSQKELNIFKNKKNKILYLSKRFSAKEAFVKSLGTGFRYNICFADISILNDKKGKPYFIFKNGFKNRPIIAVAIENNIPATNPLTTTIGFESDLISLIFDERKQGASDDQLHCNSRRTAT